MIQLGFTLFVWILIGMVCLAVLFGLINWHFGITNNHKVQREILEELRFQNRGE